MAASVGIAVFGEHGEDADALLQHADVAMYLAKGAHAGTAVYSAEQDTNDAERLALAGELRRAIEQEELVVHYQPKADLQTGRIVGVEALVRWIHPERGFIPPDAFIPIAERTGLIKPLSTLRAADGDRPVRRVGGRGARPPRRRQPDHPRPARSGAARPDRRDARRRRASRPGNSSSR